jgi:hypothetical protein
MCLHQNVVELSVWIVMCQQTLRHEAAVVKRSVVLSPAANWKPFVHKSKQTEVSSEVTLIPLTSRWMCVYMYIASHAPTTF